MPESTEERQAREDIRAVSRELVAADLIEYYGGDISVRVGDDDMMVTRHHTNKSVPGPEDIVRTGIDHDDENTNVATSALWIHRAIYRQTEARAVIHAHPSKTVTLSFFHDEIRPPDENGKLYLGDVVPVVRAPLFCGWNLVADELAAALVQPRIVVLKWHGIFARGVDLADAFHRTRALEFVADKMITIALLQPHMPPIAYPPTEEAEFIGGIERPGLRRVRI